MFSASFAAELIGGLPLCFLLEGKFSGNDFGNDQLYVDYDDHGESLTMI